MITETPQATRDRFIDQLQAASEPADEADVERLKK